jgi:transcriptional regulator with XRE-family HTH domain
VSFTFDARTMRPSPLRARRFLRGERLRDTATASGLTEHYVSQAERGERELAGRVLHSLAIHFQTDAAVLVQEMRRWRARETQRQRDRWAALLAREAGGEAKGP